MPAHLIMVALELGEHLLLYIMATTELVSMVLFTKRPELEQPQALKGAPTAKSGSQDIDHAEGLWDREASGPQIAEATLSPEPQMGS
jgi:hypothetical protein